MYSADYSGLAKLYERQCLEVMEEWADQTIDEKNGGFLTDYGENFKLHSRGKNIWAQARQTYMFAACGRWSHNPKWVSIAKTGREFLVKHAYAGGGRWNYELSEDGKNVLGGTCSVFTDLFVLSALAEYAAAADSKEDLKLITSTFSEIKKNLQDPCFKDLFPHTWVKGIRRFSPYMIAVNAVGIAEPVLGEEARVFVDQCMDIMSTLFFEKECGYLLESIREDGSLWDTPEGRSVKPGHIMEGMWFCADQLIRQGREDEMGRILAMIDHVAENAWDREWGGILFRLDCSGRPPLETEGEFHSFDKIDWVNCESLYAAALAAVYGGEEGQWMRFQSLHTYCQNYFRPDQGGDWYPALNRQGLPIKKNKGGKHRVAFHVPRALMNLSVLFGEHAGQACGKEIGL